MAAWIRVLGVVDGGVIEITEATVRSWEKAPRGSQESWMVLQLWHFRSKSLTSLSVSVCL